MSDRKRKASSLEEPVCVLCGRSDVDPDIVGYLCQKNGIRVHSFCLLFATGLYQEDNFLLGILGFSLAAITRKVKQATQKQCFVCGERGAAITCAESDCERSFHLPCAVEGECVTQFFGMHSSYCCKHRPRQAVQEDPEHDINCLICLEPVGDSTAYHRLVCPACKHAWFHRDCIQLQAFTVGAVGFQCPVCRDEDLFHLEMSTMGIQIPARGQNTMEYDPPVLQRHSHCDASECLYHGGREQAESSGPWQLLLCSSCAAEGTHRQCSHLNDTTATWECNSCAALRTASSANTELAGPCTASERAPGPSSSSMEPETLGSMPASQAALGTTSQSSQLPEHSDLPRAEGIRVLQGVPGSCSQKTSQAAGKKPHTKPLPAARSGPEFPEPAKKTPWQPANASPRAAERHPVKVCHFQIPEGFQSARMQGTVQAATAHPHPQPSSAETSGSKFPQLTPRRQQEAGSVAEDIAGMKLLPGTTSETKSPHTAPSLRRSSRAPVIEWVEKTTTII
ncbi:PHD finger protein 7-like [Lagopus leucura]|uniref:PHD finger protein 7-like n=2 Tax=Lagopus leucura TaxID=30410 RepID=UPI001C66FBD5|nr:PHD finger protein 7-like [Lagopus leucura]